MTDEERRIAAMEKATTHAEFAEILVEAGFPQEHADALIRTAMRLAKQEAEMH